MSGMAGLLQHILIRIAAMGALGKGLFVLLYAVGAVLFFPVTPMSLGAGAVFGVGTGFALVTVGGTIGACVSFMIARHWLRGWVEKRFASHPKFAAIDAAVSTQGWRVVFLTRLTPLFPFCTLNYAYGVTRVGFKDYAAASFFGIMPATVVTVYVGAAAEEAVRPGARTRSVAEWAFFAVGLLATVAAVASVARGAKRALERHSGPTPSAK